MGATAMSSSQSHGASGRALSSRQQLGSACSLTFGNDVDGQQQPRGGVNLNDFLRGWPQQQTQPGHDHGHYYHAAAVVGRPVPRPLGVGAGPVLDALYHHHHHDGGGHEAAGGLANGRCVAPVDADGGVVEERSNERRKKRMIKNRESAARSRARKQAYTNELENKIAELEEENERLRSQMELEPVVQYVPQLELKNQLRRTNSASF